MNTNGGLGRCLSFINCQLRPSERKAGGREPRPVRAVTISRQAGCGAMEVATKLAARLQAETPLDQPQWTVFDRNLMEQVLADHNLPARLARILINLGQQYGKLTAEGIAIGIKLSQEELGNLVGVSRESVNRQVRLWVESGVLDYTHGTIILKNSDALFRESLNAER